MTIPTYREASARMSEALATELDKLIFDYEPTYSKTAAKRFRTQLQAVLDEAVKKRKVKK